MNRINKIKGFLLVNLSSGVVVRHSAGEQNTAAAAFRRSIEWSAGRLWGRKEGRLVSGAKE